MRDRITSHALIRWVERAMLLEEDVAEARRAAAEAVGVSEDGVFDGVVIDILEKTLPGFDADKIRDAILDAGGRFALTNGLASYRTGGVTLCISGGYIATVVKGRAGVMRGVKTFGGGVDSVN